MTTFDARKTWSRAQIWFLAALLVTLAFLVQGDIGLNMNDEGYLWYGAWRTGHGEVPRLDFRSYDAPRNYWLAFWALFLGDGPLDFRFGVAIFQAIGLGFGLLAARRTVSAGWLLPPIGVLLLIWMYPRHKLFEHAIAMTAVYVVLIILEKPGRRRFFIGGFFVGLAGSFRRNHALYTFVATSTAILQAIERPFSFRKLVQAFFPFLLGITAGFFPVWILMALYQGFGSAYLDSILVILRRGQTNQLLPIPWPWLVESAGKDSLMTVHQLALGMAFVFLFSFFPLAVFRLWKTRGRATPQRNLLLASTLVGLPYAHHAIARSDVSHLCQAAHPVLLGSLALTCLAGTRWRQFESRAVGTLLVALTLTVPLFVQPAIVRWVRSPRPFVNLEIAGDNIWVTRRQARIIAAARSLSQQESDPGDLFYFAPMSTALYRILERPSPVWDPYPIWPPSLESSEQMIEDLEGSEVKWAIVDGGSIGGDHFWDTHPRVWRYLQSSFERIETTSFPATYTVLRRIKSADDGLDTAK